MQGGQVSYLLPGCDALHYQNLRLIRSKCQQYAEQGPRAYSTVIAPECISDCAVR